jgi:hypothetical protein
MVTLMATIPTVTAHMGTMLTVTALTTLTVTMLMPKLTTAMTRTLRVITASTTEKKFI